LENYTSALPQELLKEKNQTLVNSKLTNRNTMGKSYLKKRTVTSTNPNGGHVQITEKGKNSAKWLDVKGKLKKDGDMLSFYTEENSKGKPELLLISKR